ncbi:hypothetical protein PHLGIDRAFT_17228 [Phlebiopsis gigantea 11061_1 CR5-6]|uniref:Uncharacterized protein n=1 Tax=Phlebiopsis gigantea (strain 11061_1 CR5-6) TaxID=745531 RepID=A0A0C3NA88_PHLG1|nr:hypothetical protein PHLGIDRAFT_17228 [Phlebiopsis gigantea 11061_1 CR5-6]
MALKRGQFTVQAGAVQGVRGPVNVCLYWRPLRPRSRIPPIPPIAISCARAQARTPPSAPPRISSSIAAFDMRASRKCATGPGVSQYSYYLEGNANRPIQNAECSSRAQQTYLRNTVLSGLTPASAWRWRQKSTPERTAPAPADGQSAGRKSQPLSEAVAQRRPEIEAVAYMLARLPLAAAVDLRVALDHLLPRTFSRRLPVANSLETWAVMLHTEMKRLKTLRRVSHAGSALLEQRDKAWDGIAPLVPRPTSKPTGWLAICYPVSTNTNLATGRPPPADVRTNVAPPALRSPAYRTATSDLLGPPPLQQANRPYAAEIPTQADECSVQGGVFPARQSTNAAQARTRTPDTSSGRGVGFYMLIPSGLGITTKWFEREEFPRTPWLLSALPEAMPNVWSDRTVSAPPH